MPFNEVTGNAIGAGYVGMLKIEFVQNTAAITDIINYWGVAGRKNAGLLPPPYNLSKHKLLDGNDISMSLLTRCVFLWKDARKFFMKNSIEVSILPPEQKCY